MGEDEVEGNCMGRSYGLGLGWAKAKAKGNVS
jgi:hypothetical protein